MFTTALVAMTVMAATPLSPAELSVAPESEAAPLSGELRLLEPLRGPRVAQVLVPVAPQPVFVDARDNLFLIGLGLVGAGLVLGGAGFGVLYYCGQGTGYCSDTVNTLGWILAAPGLIPLAVGGVLVYIALNSRGRYAAKPASMPMWAVGAVPLPGGGAARATFAF